MKKIFLIAKTVFLALLLSACGGGGGSDASFESGNTTNNSTKIQIVDCNTPPVYTSIQTGDVLVKETTPTTVNIVHDSNNNKEVCVSSGMAHLLRGN